MRTYFISGHRLITKDEWDKYYRPGLAALIREQKTFHSSHEWQKSETISDISFVVGDYQGIDTIAQVFLWISGARNLTVYHMLDKPRNNPCDWPTIGGFKTDEERDTQMTLDSDYDFAWFNPVFLNSGTEQNIMRRKKIEDALKNGSFKGV